MAYNPRIADGILRRKLEGKGAVLIEGPKWCGKTTTAEQMAGSVVYMADPAIFSQNMDLAMISPGKLLDGVTPRLIDEWQVAPSLWDAVRFEVDHRHKPGQFILTGSAVPPDKSGIIHTGTGRFAWLTMRTMSLWESGDSSGEVSLTELFDEPEEIFGTNNNDIEALAYLICRGGWPQVVSMSKRIALDQAFDYVDAVVNADLSRVDGVRRSADRAMKIMRSYARHQGSQASLATIAEDVSAGGMAITPETVAGYVEALKKIFVVEDTPAWNPNLRSKTAIRSAETRYFTDPSIAVASLGVGPADLLNDLNTMGLMFEAMCMRDLRVYADAIDGKVYHYRDKTELECDAVVHLRNGRYGLVEIKLGGDRLIAEGVATLEKLAGKIDTDRMPEPAFKMVLTGTGKYAYRRKDGIYIVPVGCLKD